MTKIIYVLPGANRCGGVKVIAEHVTGLVTRGYDAAVWGLAGDFNWFGRPVPHRKFPNTDALGAALRSTTPKVSVATFYTSNEWVSTTLNPRDRGFALTQDLDESVYGGDNSGRAYRFPLKHITESDFIRDELKSIHNVDSTQVGIGLDHRTFRPLPFIRDQFRLFTPCRTTSAGPAGLKGWDIARDVAKRVVAIEPRASLVTFGIETPDPITFMPHTHVLAPTDRKLRELYSQCGVFLSASRREGFNLPALEAMACGSPVVCTDAGGNREYCRHRDTAMVHQTTDVDGLAKSVVAVMNDRTLADTIAKNGYNGAQRYQWGRVIDNLVTLFS